MPLMGQEKVVMRILDVSRGAPTIESLGFASNGKIDFFKTVDIANSLGMFYNSVFISPL